MHRNNANTDKFNTCNPAICLATHMWPHAIIKQTTQITLTQRQHSRYMAKLDFIVFMLPLLSLAIGYWHWIFSHLHISPSPYAELRRTSSFVQMVSWVAPFYSPSTNAGKRVTSSARSCRNKRCSTSRRFCSRSTDCALALSAALSELRSVISGCDLAKNE